MNETVERYSSTGSLQSGPYLFKPINLPVFYDIAYESNDANGDIWYACDDSDSPIKAFNTAGALTNNIWNTVVPAAHGLCFESDRYLWASNTYDDELYRIDLSPEGIEPGDVLNEVSLTSNSNPFESSVIINGTGFSGESELRIFDITGRNVFTSAFEGSLNWNGTDQHGNSLPAGSYIVNISNDGLLNASLRLIKL